MTKVGVERGRGTGEKRLLKKNAIVGRDELVYLMYPFWLASYFYLWNTLFPVPSPSRAL